MTPIGSTYEHLIVALERCGLGMFGPIGFEGDLRDLAVVAQPGGDPLGALRRTAMQEHHVRMLCVDLIELVPDQAMIVTVEAAGEGDLRPGRQMTSVSARRLAARKSRLSITAEVTARWFTIEPLRGCQYDPVWTGEVVGRLVAKVFHTVASLDQRHALGCDTLQFDRADFGAILVALARF